ncbi:hypothetical protein [Acanthopleuribacter pedis]|uniref:Uncharacterized protein n=1 Tax=Acanthopleuribacter pedis TaxID=442870 RepID=A0A8J7U8P6_9BACT|nr:hypothetical protein [Acanthopleuribacter pedis]MBO1322791.1 hypothetical protein [Acanthopleuribacter pedis]
MPPAYAKKSATVIVVRPLQKEFTDAAEGLEDHIDYDFRLVPFFLSKQDRRRQNVKMKRFHQLVETEQPSMFVLMNNYSVEFMRHFQETYPTYRKVPCLVMMAVFAEKAVSRLPNATGIQYEVPAVTNLVNLRSLMKQPVQRVGVVYRPHLRRFIAEQKALCAKELISLTGIEVQNGWGMPRRIRSALKTLIEDHEVDALWVINDSELLSKRLIRRAWNPALKHFKSPVVTSLENFVSNPNLMGSFAVVPDHYELGRQASDLLSKVKRSHWRAGNLPMRYPFSVRKIVNLDKINAEVLIRKRALMEMDQVISTQPESMLSPKDGSKLSATLTNARRP